MPKRPCALTDTQIDQAKPKPKLYKLHDGYGLFLVIYPRGSKSWRVSYRFKDKRYYMTLGPISKFSLSDARALNNEIRRQAKEGIDPMEKRKQEVIAEKAQCNGADSMPRLCVLMDGAVEIWKGRNVVRLTSEEAVFIKEQLVLLT